MNVKVFNLISGVDEARFIVLHESCECICGLNKSGCNTKQKRNHDKCRCECKDLDDWGSCIKDYMWNPSTCDCECNKACKIDEYLDIKICSCEKILIRKLVLECEDEILNTTETSPNDEKEIYKKNNCLIHAISLIIICIVIICCFYWL